MVNYLIDKDKKDNPAAPDAQTSPQPAQGVAVPDAVSAQDFNQAALGAYGPQTAAASALTAKAWEEAGQNAAHGHPWMEDRGKRLAIRTFSRGLLGAAFFTAGGMLTSKWMHGGTQGGHGYFLKRSLGEQLPFAVAKDGYRGNPLKTIAKIIDSVVGKPIKLAFGEKAVLFRDTQYKRVGNNWGRTLGDEAVNITFDFFCASVGDAFGRDIIGFFDPSVKKEWRDEKGHVKLPETIKGIGKKLWEYVSLRGGEDWAVAIPYAYYMKGQRSLIDKVSPGFKYDFDRQLNGGSFKVNKEGRVIGNYNLEGMADLQGRFTAYNIGTLMYREWYDHMAHILAGKPDHLYGAADPDPKRGVLGSVADIGKWVARSVVKGVITMTPAVPFFWITRSTQGKHRGLFINRDLGVMTHAKKNGRDAVYANDIIHGHMRRDEEVAFSRYDPAFMVRNNNGNPFERTRLPRRLSTITVDGKPAMLNSSNPATHLDPTKLEEAVQAGPKFHPYHTGTTLLGQGSDWLGEAQHQAAKRLTPLSKKLDQNLGQFGVGIKNFLGFKDDKDSPFGKESFKRFTHPFARASMSYTPYMMAKGEASLKWDTGKMDMASERMIDGATSLNLGEFTAGAGEVWRTVWGRKLADPAREAEGERRNTLDRAKPDIFEETESQMEEDKRKSELSWQERTFSGRPAKARGGDGASLENPYNIARRGAYSDTATRPSISHAEQEEMKKLLREAEPPTSSVH